MHGFIHTCTPKPGDSTSELGGVNHVSSSPKKAFRYAMSQKKLGPFKLVVLGEAQQVWSLSKAPFTVAGCSNHRIGRSPGQSWENLVAASICHAKLRRPRGSGKRALPGKQWFCVVIC